MRKKLIVFSEADLEFLRAVGIDPESANRRMIIAHPDGTVKILESLGIPVTRENYLMLAFAGNPPEEPLDGELEAELPKELQQYDEDEED